MAINSESIDDLIAAGRHAEAANRALAEGEPGRAADLYEKLWDFRGALAAARAAADVPRSLRYALELHDDIAIADVLAQLTVTDEGARVALDLLSRMRRHAQAAALAERLGDLPLAIDLYTRAHAALDAARLLEAVGRDRDAGRMLERALDLATDAERAPIKLALGRILARRGAYPEATRLLQDVRHHLELAVQRGELEPQRGAELRSEAQRHLIATLAAMGLRDGARDALVELRTLEADVSPDLDTYLRAWRDQTAERKTGRDREVVAGRYRLERLLGAGASGRVFLATDEVAGRQVALKMFFASSARGGAAYERFVREARLASTLRHPSLVEVYDVSVERGFLVMEYLPGGSLAQRLVAPELEGGVNRLPAPQIRRMALDIISGLEAAHHRGVIHRDVKPANIFFDARGTARLGDFGVAHLVDLGQTQTGGLIGTLAYMSPEQITGAPISIAADLYALGVTLFEVVTGRLPFLGPDFVAQHLGEEAPIASKVAEGVEPGWDRVLAALLVKNPRDRTPTLADLRQQLEQYQEGRNKPAVLPVGAGMRPQIGGRRRRSTAPHSIAQLAEQSEVGPRYQFETVLGATSLSQLARAVDTVLDRSVVLEYFNPSDEATRAIERARLLGRAQSPFVQRALGLDRAARSAVFEAPAGAALADATPQLPPAEAIRLLKRLARAAASIHELGGSHGSIGPRTVVLDDNAIPTVLAAGLGPVLEATPLDDITALLALVATIVGCDPTLLALATTLCDAVGASVPSLATPHDGETLYIAADAIDVAVLAALGAR